MARATWSSKLGFVLAVAGSAIGLANIWRMPYIVGENGGGAFLVVYLLCLLLIGFPVFMAEMVIGRAAQTSPSGAFQKISGNKSWSLVGKLTILTGFIVSSFYSAVAGWILGYLIEAFQGNLTSFASAEHAVDHYNSLTSQPWWGVTFHFLFLLICLTVLYAGVRGGIERGNKIMMPLLLIVLVALVIKGVSLPNGIDGVRYLFQPDWSELTPMAFLIALGQAFFTLSLGQGTMVTYGSYLNKKENLLQSCVPVVIMDTVVSLLAAIAVFSIAFSGGMKPDSGPGLLFHTLPVIFGQISGGYFLAVLFFLLVVLAAITSEISAMEPAIAYLMDEKGWKRHPAVAAVGAGVFLLGIPSALSLGYLADFQIYGMNFLDFVSFLCSSILIPLGGFCAVVLVGWFWGVSNAIDELQIGAEDLFRRRPWIKTYFWFCFKWSAPILIIVVFLNALGIIG